MPYINQQEEEAIHAAIDQIGNLIERGAEGEYWPNLHQVLIGIAGKCKRERIRREDMKYFKKKLNQLNKKNQ